MLTIIHGSDLHFGSPHTPAAADDFLAVIDEYSPDLLVLSGDFTQRAKVGEYRAARAFLERLPSIHVVVTPGNHDVPLYRVFERLLAPYRNYRRYIQGELDTVVRLEGATVVSLNTAAPHRAIVNGRVRARQLDFARGVFSASPEGDLYMVVVHHPLIGAPDDEGGPPLPGAGAIVGELSAMGVELILSGHLHRSFATTSVDVDALPSGFNVVHCGTTTSSRGRAAELGHNSCNVVRVYSDRFEVTHLLRQEKSEGFRPSGGAVLPRFGTRLPVDPSKNKTFEAELIGGDG